jgi:sortase A
VRSLSRIGPWLRRGEVALSAIGFVLLCWALGKTLTARLYQVNQGRVFSHGIKRVPAARAGGDPLVLGRIEIPRIAAIVREGDDDATLAIAVGHIPGTAQPGERGNMALAGHRDSFFRALRGIRRQDAIRFVTHKGSYEYVVDSTGIVSPEETSILDPTSDTVLSLVTCYPFKYVGHAPKRFIVRASLIGLLPSAASEGEVLEVSEDPITAVSPGDRDPGRVERRPGELVGGGMPLRRVGR